MHLETGSKINLINKMFVTKAWRKTIQQYNGRGVKTVNNNKLDVQGFIRLKIILGDLRVKFCFSVSRTSGPVAKRVILGTPFYYRLIRGCFPNETKIVPKNSRPSANPNGGP